MIDSVVHQDARYAWNRELRIEVNHSCNKLHATHEIANYALRLIIRATSCTLRMKLWITHRGKSFVQQVARYAWNYELRIAVNHSCNKLHTTDEIANYASRLIIRASRCTLRMKSWITHWGESFVQQVARYAWNHELRIKLIIRASRCTLRTI